MDQPEPVPLPSVLTAYGISASRYLGGGHHQNWLAERAGERVVLRRHVRPPIGDLAYEFLILEELSRARWPVPIPLADPVQADGSTWSLLAWLPGEHRTDAWSEREQELRAAELVALHATTGELASLGQRPGCVESHELLADPALDGHLAAYERWYPDEARLMRWHLDRARLLFDAVDTSEARRVVLHGDFTPWNLLYEGDRLTGVVDLEAAHVNFLVAEFAGAWRGEADYLLSAYDGIDPLEEIDWALLVPAFWSWMFLGVADAITAMRSGAIEPRELRWTVTNLVKRTPLMGAESAPYRP